MVLHLRDAIERVFLALAMVQLCPDSVGSVGRKLIRFRVHYSFEVQVESTYCEWQTAYLRPYILPPFVHSAETLRLPWKLRGRSMGGITVPVNVEPYHNEFCPCLFAVIINEPAIPVNGSVFWGYSFGMCVMRVSHPFSGVFLLQIWFFSPRTFDNMMCNSVFRLFFVLAGMSIPSQWKTDNVRRIRGG